MDNIIKRKHIVLVGGGFAGFNFLRQLFGNGYYDVTLVDKNNYNYFTPLLYQVATSFLEPAAISYPYRKLFEKKNIAFRMAEVSAVNTDGNCLYLNDGGRIYYDILVFAAGSQTNFFNNDAINAYAVPLKDVNDALYMRNKLIKTLERASIEESREERRKWLTIVIAGGGPTGVELAGMMAEFKHVILPLDYPELKDCPMTIYLVEGESSLLPPMSMKTHEEAYNALNRLGIVVKLNTRVSDCTADQVLLSDGGVIDAKTLIWTAGITANQFEGMAETSIGTGGRMITDQFNKVKGYENIYAIGDIAVQYMDDSYPHGHPQLAQPAIQQGRRLAKNLLRSARGRSMKPFKYFDRGEMAIIGRKWAVADLFKHKVHIGGLFGLLTWLFIHLISLVNYNNKIRTLYSWLIAYFTHDQVLRMIFRSDRKQGTREKDIHRKEQEQHLQWINELPKSSAN
jgi:NADH dehydrogenase